MAGPGGAQAVARLSDQLNRKGNKWDYRISDPTEGGSGHQKERYAFIWKTASIRLVARPTLSSSLERLVLREPYIAHFEIGSEQIAIANYHSKRYDEHPEEEVKYFPNMINEVGSVPLIIAGDFNMTEEHPVFDQLEQLNFRPVITKQLTTLRRSCKSQRDKHPYLANAIDNIYFPTPDFVATASGTIDYVQACENLDYARQLSRPPACFLSVSVLQLTIKYFKECKTQL